MGRQQSQIMLRSKLPSESDISHLATWLLNLYFPLDHHFLVFLKPNKVIRLKDYWTWVLIVFLLNENKTEEKTAKPTT
jgi:hypothetical protein